MDRRQQLLLEWGCWRRRCKVRCTRHPLPTDELTMPLEGQASSAEILEDRAQRRQPLGAQNHVITCKRHNKQIDEENIAMDSDRRLTYDANA
jgi:hypothetical protein